MKYLGPVARMGDKRKNTKMWLESLKERGYWEDRRIVWRIILN